MAAAQGGPVELHRLGRADGRRARGARRLARRQPLGRCWGGAASNDRGPKHLFDQDFGRTRRRPTRLRRRTSRRRWRPRRRPRRSRPPPTRDSWSTRQSRPRPPDRRARRPCGRPACCALTWIGARRGRAPRHARSREILCLVPRSPDGRLACREQEPPNPQTSHRPDVFVPGALRCCCVSRICAAAPAGENFAHLILASSETCLLLLCSRIGGCG
mmetsp:Transcript_27797/g.89228  ORF Transcript_27797/g.89228 Transcript_27797/m.89228 type:complete len:216 (-) Transcript_27797:27-674(-)